MQLTLVPAQGTWVDFGSALHPRAWYGALRTAGYDGVILDCMAGGVQADYEHALASRLGVMWFQGYWEPAWSVGAQAARERAQQAAGLLHSWGVPVGAIVWLDSEAWPSDVTAEAAAEWITAWATVLAGEHLTPGLYVGAGQPLDAAQLWALPNVARYWHSASDVPTPDVRGYQLVQVTADTMFDGVAVDIDKPQRDHLGSTPWAIVGEPTPVPVPPAPAHDQTVLEMLGALRTDLQALRTDVQALRQAVPTRGTLTLQ